MAIIPSSFHTNVYWTDGLIWQNVQNTNAFDEPFSVSNLQPPISIHMMTAFPKFRDVTFKVLDHVDMQVWCGIFISIMTLALTMLLVLTTYIKISPRLSHVLNDPTQIWLRFIGGAVEALHHKLFKMGRAAIFLTMIFELLSYTIITVYNSNLRAYIIGEVPDVVPTNLEEVPSGHGLVLYTEHGIANIHTEGKVNSLKA